MIKWSEQQPIDSDWLDKTLPIIEELFKKHLKTALKIAAPLIGFLIFFSYFQQNRFFPSFDLFSFSSLLLAAFIFATLLLAVLTILIATPGWLIFNLFLNTKDIKEEILYALPYLAKDKQSKKLELLRLSVLWPLTTTTAIQLAIILSTPDFFIGTMLIAPALISLLAGINLQIRFNLNKYSFFIYFAIGFIAAIANTLLWTTLTSIFSTLIESTSIEPLQLVNFIAIALSTCFFAAFAAMGHFSGWRHSLYISAAIATLFAVYSGTLTALPGKFIRSLSLGNYTSDVLISKQYCEEKLLGKIIQTDQGCLVKNAQIIWSLGDSTILNADLPDYRHIKIPSTAIKVTTLNNSE